MKDIVQKVLAQLLHIQHTIEKLKRDEPVTYVGYVRAYLYSYLWSCERDYWMLIQRQLV